MRNKTLGLSQFLFVVVALARTTSAADPLPVRFDLPSTAPATTADQLDLVTVQLRLSSLIEDPTLARISQWMIRCVPRQQGILVADYAPRTETSSELATPIQVKTINEQTFSSGVSVDGTYGNLVHANLGADRGKKQSNAVQFDRVAPEQAVIAAGTIERGRGVYFKLRWTASQVLEGEKLFQLTLQVPTGWRGGLIDVSVTAQAVPDSISPWSPPTWDRDPRLVGAANFVVAAYRADDIEAEAAARAVARAEQRLRSAAAMGRAHKPAALSTMIRQLASKLDLEPERSPQTWIHRVLTGDADPHFDKQIQQLAMPLRVAILDYIDSRNALTALTEPSQQPVVAAKAPL